MTQSSNDSIKLLNEKIKNIIHKSLPNKIKIIGEVIQSRVSHNHQYVVIKDDYSDIHGVIWNVSSKNYALDENKKYEIYGTIDTYTKNCSVQINISNAIQLGISNEHTKLLELKKKLSKEGIFDKKKGSLPDTITTIGILTSHDSAALTDILSVLTKNNYKDKVIVKNCLVQGKQCVESVVNGIKWFEDKNIDVLIITRGGGSDTDLIHFSDELIIREIYNCKHIVISAIGHERDNLLCDEVSDIRASTPTYAGHLVYPLVNNKEELETKLGTLYDLINNKLEKITPTNTSVCKHTDYDHKIKKLRSYIELLLNNLKTNIRLQTQNIIITNHSGSKSITTLAEFNKYKSKGLTIHFADGECEL